MEDELRRQLDARRYAGAFELLVAQFREKVFRLAFSMLRNETQAEDAAQEVFLRIWRALPGYHGGASVGTWVYTITRNTCLSELKKRAASATVSLDCLQAELGPDTLPALQSCDPQAGAGQDVLTLLGQLPEKYRQAITLFYLEQKAYGETAAMLGVPLGTVKTLLFRAKKELLRIASRPPPATTRTGQWLSQPTPRRAGAAAPVKTPGALIDPGTTQPRMIYGV
jgi:RNA polymerase sigma-70 factor (ECF subfamily)